VPMAMVTASHWSSVLPSLGLPKVCAEVV
jgi:hypothetical protein